MSKLKEKMRLPDRGADLGKNNLAILFSRIMARVKMTTKKIEENNRAYIRDPINCIPDDSSKRSSAAGNIRKEIERETLTWRSFEKLLRWMRPAAATVHVVLDWKDGTRTVESIKICIDDYDPKKDPEELALSDASVDDLQEELRLRGYEVTISIPGLNDDKEN